MALVGVILRQHRPSLRIEPGRDVRPGRHRSRVAPRGLVPLREYLDRVWGDVLEAFRLEADSHFFSRTFGCVSSVIVNDFTLSRFR